MLQAWEFDKAKHAANTHQHITLQQQTLITIPHLGGFA
jgi:hypothetical protein